MCQTMGVSRSDAYVDSRCILTPLECTRSGLALRIARRKWVRYIVASIPPETRFAKNADRPMLGPRLAARPASPKRLIDVGKGMTLASTPNAWARERRGRSEPVTSDRF